MSSPHTEDSLPRITPKLSTLERLIAGLCTKGISIYSDDGFNLKIKSPPSISEFDFIVCAIMREFKLRPQSTEYSFPGTPTGDVEDFGWYLQPYDPSTWEEGDFRLFLNMYMISWEIVETT
jgi:hypothetical protein